MLKLDAWLLENVYQRLVNLLHKEPSWFVEQCAFALFLTTGMRYLFEPVHSPMGYFTIFIGLVCAGIFFYYSRIPVHMAAMGSRQLIRIFLMMLTVYSVIAYSFGDGPVPLQIVNIIYQVVFGSVYYFAACKSPPPPERRHKLVPTT